ncbi:hypothetical protein POM88_004183 [Heracleum sosnowskyi]|nr:hypothetical protein POM88_004183 [Heracleum sosnowskyi]
MGYGGNDALADVKDVQRTIKELQSKPDMLYLENYGHIDFLLSIYAKRDVYDSLISFFRLAQVVNYCQDRLAQDFYEDLFEELDKYGEIESLNVCDNLADHMVGNVYVQFREAVHALNALKNLIGRCYAGRPIIVDYLPVTDFREATCRQYDENICNRGGYCNFMHLKIGRELRRQLFGRIIGLLRIEDLQNFTKKVMVSSIYTTNENKGVIVNRSYEVVGESSADRTPSAAGKSGGLHSLDALTKRG